MTERSEQLPIQVAVRAIIINDEQKVMLIRRAMGTSEAGKWHLVGGKPNEGENLDEAIKRETEEEVGSQFLLTYLMQVENPNTSTGVRWITHYFLGFSNCSPTRLNPSEVSEAAFFSEADLEGLDIAFDHKDVLIRYLTHLSKDL